MPCGNPECYNLFMQLNTSPPPVAPLDGDAFRALAHRFLLSEPPTSEAGCDSDGSRPRLGDFDLDPMLRHEAPACPAAVLVPVVARPEVTLLFTQRTEHLPSHAGQIAFPGGKTEAHDAGPLATALREAKEEIGLDPNLVEALGYLDPYRTGTGFKITPVVALVEPDFHLNLNAHEVIDVFEVPLHFLMDERNHQRHQRVIGGRERNFHAMPYGQRFIWGATAGILKNMHERLFRT